MKAFAQKWLALLLVAGMLLGGGSGLTAHAQQPTWGDSQAQTEVAGGETPTADSSTPEEPPADDTLPGAGTPDNDAPADDTAKAPDADSAPDASGAPPEDNGAADDDPPSSDDTADTTDEDTAPAPEDDAPAAAEDGAAPGTDMPAEADATPEADAPPEADVAPEADTTEADETPADLDTLLALAAKDGAEAARLLNLYGDDTAYLEALQALLVFYYSLEQPSDQQAPFLAGLGARGQALAGNFAAAADERATDPYTLGYMPGEVLVQFRSYLSEARAEAATEELDGSLEVVLLETNNRLTTVVDIPIWQTVAQAIEAFTADPNVVFAEPDYVLRLEDEPTAEYVATGYAALPGPEQSMADETLSPEAVPTPNDSGSQWHHDRIHTTPAWALLPDKGAGNEVVVAVIDTMPNTEHEDLEGAFLTEHIKSFDRNGVTTTREAEPGTTKWYHATMVAGIIAATADNSKGGYGVAAGNATALNQTVRLMALDAQADSAASISTMTQAIKYAYTNGAQVITISLGGVFNAANYSTLTTAIQAAEAANAVVVCSAGNEAVDDTTYANETLHYPSDYDTVLGVIYLNNTGTDYITGINPRASNSNYGWHKNISAPGSLIYSTGSNTGRAQSTSYYAGSGSSYAAPMVAAVAALVLYANPALTAQQVMDILCATAIDVHLAGRDRETGYGCVNAEAAVRMALTTLLAENLAATDGYGKVSLTWDAVPGAAGYKVYAQAPGGSMALLDTLPATTTTYTHQSLAVAGQYRYEVTTLTSLTRQNVVNKKLPYTDAATDHANITTEAVSIEGVAAATTITVRVPAAGVAVAPASFTLAPGQTTTLAATVSPAAASDKTVRWSSLDPAVASVSSTGVVTALANGSATITATTTDGGFTASCVVTVRTPVTGVAVDAPTMTLEPGETGMLAATIAPPAATNPAISWQSSNPAVASVEGGVVTAVAVGTATISVVADDGGHTASCTVTVAAPVTAVKLPQTTLSLVKGKNLTLSAAAITSDGSTASLSWTSSDEAVATVTAGGTIKAVGTGKAVITATAQNGKSVSLKVAVVKKANTKVTAVSASVPKTMTAGTKKTISGKYTPSSATGVKVSFTSSKSSVLAVSSAGVLTAKKAGTAVITVKAGTASRKYTVTVKAPAATALKLSKATATVRKGRTTKLKVSVSPSYADKAVTWTSSNKKVATVSSAGVVKGVKKGTATITVTAKKGKKKATCVVTVK